MNKPLIKWLGLGLIIKLILFLLFVYAMHTYWPKGDIVKGICFIGNDTKSYYEPIERLINGEGYSYLKSSLSSLSGWEIAPMGYRMPGLLPIYGPLYYFFGGSWAKFIVIILQLIAEVISVYLLAKAASLLFKNFALFIPTLFLYLLNTVVSVYTAYAYSESFCISFFIFSLYFLIRYGVQAENKFLFLAGLFLCWSMFFRPVIVIFLPFYFFIILYYLYQHKKNNFLIISGHLLVFCAVFIMAEGLWVSRNYIVFNRFIPLYSGFDSYNSKQEMALFKLIIAWGGDVQDWNPSEGRWFVVPSDSKTRVYDEAFQKSNPFRKSVFTPDYNYDSLLVLRQDYWRALGYATTKDSLDAESAIKRFSVKIDRYFNSYKNYRPMDFYVISKLRHLKTFVCIERPYAFPFVQKNVFQKSLRVVSVLFYYFIMIFGAIGMFLSFKMKNSIVAISLSAGALAFIFIHAYLGSTEFRYLLPTYPVLTLFAAYSLYEIIGNRTFKHKITHRDNNS